MFLKLVPQSVLDSSSTGKRIARGIFSQAAYYIHLTSRYSPATPAEFTHKGSTLDYAQAKLCGKSLVTSMTFSEGGLSLSSPSKNSSGTISPSPLSLCPASLPNQELSQKSGDVTIIFPHDAGPAVYDAFLRLDTASTTPSARTLTLKLARRFAQMASAFYTLCEKECGGDRRQKGYLKDFGQLLRFASIQLASAILHFPQRESPASSHNRHSQHLSEASQKVRL